MRSHCFWAVSRLRIYCDVFIQLLTTEYWPTVLTWVLSVIRPHEFVISRVRVYQLHHMLIFIHDTLWAEAIKRRVKSDEFLVWSVSLTLSCVCPCSCVDGSWLWSSTVTVFPLCFLRGRWCDGAQRSSWTLVLDSGSQTHTDAERWPRSSHTGTARPVCCFIQSV